ncbi:copper homeostasis protein CutC [Lactococcus cremoris]
MIIRELCLENFTKVPQALQAGIERIELCAILLLGTTLLTRLQNWNMCRHNLEMIQEAAIVYNSHNLKLLRLIHSKLSKLVLKTLYLVPSRLTIK